MSGRRTPPRRVLLLGTLPQRRHRATPVSDPSIRLISISRRVAGQLDAAGVPHTPSQVYFHADAWTGLHNAVSQTVEALAHHRNDTPPAAWLDDWSHLLGAELCDAFYWTRVAEQVLCRERPSQVLLQRVRASDPTFAALAALRSAFEVLGSACADWRPARS
ncbi:MAG: hypothetical protein ABI629_20485 [bacterium]